MESPHLVCFLTMLWRNCICCAFQKCDVKSCITSTKGSGDKGALSQVSNTGDGHDNVSIAHVPSCLTSKHGAYSTTIWTTLVCFITQSKNQKPSRYQVLNKMFDTVLTFEGSRNCLY